MRTNNLQHGYLKRDDINYIILTITLFLTIMLFSHKL